MRAVVAEDNALLLEGLTRILESHDVEVTAVGDADALVTAVDHEVTAGRPVDVVLTDVRMPPTFTTEGLVAALALRETHPGLPVVVLSQHVEQVYARELLSDGRGGVGYLLKDRVMDVTAFVDTVRQVAAGGTVIDPEVVGALLRGTSRDDPVADLTGREREVLDQMAQGRSNAAIAAALFVSEKAVDKHIGHLFAKLGLLPAADDNRRVIAVLTYLQSH